MSENARAIALLRRDAAQANAEVLKGFVPQMFSSPKILTDEAADTGDNDNWMMTNIPADVLVPLAGLKLIGDADKRPEINDFVTLILRGVKGVNGFNMKVGENIATSLAGSGGQKKLMKKPGWAGRNITNRSWQDKAENEGAEVVE